MKRRLRVIGLGSAQGSDRAGWLACAALEAAVRDLPLGEEAIDFVNCATPVELPQRLEGCRAALLLDALPGEGPAFGLVRVEPAALEASGVLSSHGFGVGEGLELAAALGLLPASCSLMAIVVPPRCPDLEAGVRSLVPELCAELQRLLQTGGT
ncbi:hypothetical protein QVG61_07785 [Thiohalobacter sp. IOR34]|uniref:hypothetical protein n=1 Tax=Thiohalobacter sp. IOR34 TaxID=3057176 RepID=UPI0025B26E6C|nr:hypothetical protein [Thiohalobacter sp. IOR34]WJW74418.1 hypothetical protein QVG61_07785 [Thiohalobacter sp. IOR34]